MNPQILIFSFNISGTMVSNDPWSPLDGGQDPSTVLARNDARGAAADTGIILQDILIKNCVYLIIVT